jgi:O-antigen ligase
MFCDSLMVPARGILDYHGSPLFKVPVNLTDGTATMVYRHSPSTWMALGRAATASLVLSLIIIPLDPFSDLSDPLMTGIWEAGDFMNQAAYTIMGLLTLSMIPIRRFRQFLSGFTLLAIAAFAWLVVSALMSQNPELSLRRLGFTLLVCLTAAGWMLIPVGIRQLSEILSLVAASVLLLCYAGILLAPSHTIHQLGDFLEPGLAGDWRGIFGHKNEAGAVMVLMTFFGLFITRTSSYQFGSLIVVGAVVFLIGTEAKTSLILLPLVLGVSYLARGSATLGRLSFYCLAPLVLFNVLAVLAVYSNTTETILNSAVSDASFTGRTDVWQFAIANFLERPVLGHGFMAFWRTDQVLSESPSMDLWANTAAHSHNGYLDMALTTGFPGLLLCIAFVVIWPIISYHRYRKKKSNRVQPNMAALSTFLFQIWLFGIYFNCFESALFDRGNRVWFFMCSGVFGLYYISRFPLLNEPPPFAGNLAVRNKRRITA